MPRLSPEVPAFISLAQNTTEHSVDDISTHDSHHHLYSARGRTASNPWGNEHPVHPPAVDAVYDYSSTDGTIIYTPESNNGDVYGCHDPWSAIPQSNTADIYHIAAGSDAYNRVYNVLLQALVEDSTPDVDNISGYSDEHVEDVFTPEDAVAQLLEVDDDMSHVEERLMWGEAGYYYNNTWYPGTPPAEPNQYELCTFPDDSTRDAAVIALRQYLQDTHWQLIESRRQLLASNTECGIAMDESSECDSSVTSAPFKVGFYVPYLDEDEGYKAANQMRIDVQRSPTSDEVATKDMRIKEWQEIIEQNSNTSKEWAMRNIEEKKRKANNGVLRKPKVVKRWKEACEEVVCEGPACDENTLLSVIAR